MTTSEGIRHPELVEEFRQRLAAARLALARTVMRTEDELATLEGHQPGGPVEDAPTETVTSILSALEGRERHELDEIDAAQARLEAGVFGVCERCARAIPLARLRAIPTARFCAPCQAVEERR